MLPVSFTKKGLSYDGPEFNEIAGDLQGNILKSHGRNHTSQIFFRFKPGKVAEAKIFIKSFEHLVTSAGKQKADTKDFQDHGTQHIFTAFYLSAAGYDYLKIAPGRRPADVNFQENSGGMQASAAKLGDTIGDWDAGFKQGVHGMILLGFGGKTRAQLLERETFTVSGQLRNHNLADVFVERGDGIKNANGDDIEHFGYVDGISQPQFFCEDLSPENATQWDTLASWDLVLTEDPGGTAGKSFGSYLVFRKLEQHVRDFKQAEQVLATALKLGDTLTDPDEKKEARELAGALIVGRFENGMPVTLSSVNDELNTGRSRALPVGNNFVGKLNDFTYDSDADGARCPFHAHIRKTNPRGETKRFLDPATPAEQREKKILELIEDEKKRTMARRGIIYGTRDVHPNEQEKLDKLPNGGVGLLFMSFQQSIADQFEFIQQSWANEDRFSRGFLSGDQLTGKDPVIGQGAFDPLMHQYARTYNDAATLGKLAGPLHTVPDPDPKNTLPAIVDFGRFVTARGGEYFFAPSKTFLRTL